MPSAARIEVTEPLLDGEGGFALLAYPTAMLGDGSGANLPWMQEVPDPVTKVAWQSWAEISNARAEKLGVSIGDVIASRRPAGDSRCRPTRGAGSATTSWRSRWGRGIAWVASPRVGTTG